MTMTRLRPLFLLLTIVLAHCASLEPIASDACGNGVVDANEDCDSFPAANSASGPQCGAPTEGALACRMKCSNKGGGPTCPDGWGCGESGYCRRPSGAFEAKADPVSAGVTDVIAADFDGDGRADVAATSEVGPYNTTSLRVHYFEPGGGLARVVSLPAGIVSPAVADLDGDGLADIAFGTAGGPSGLLGVITGTKQRTFSPMLFPAIALDKTSAQVVVIKPTRLPLPGLDPTAIMMFAKNDQDASAFLISISADAGGASFNQALPADPDKLVGTPVWGSVFDANASSTCGEIAYVLQMPGQDRLFLVSPCQPAADTGASRWASTREAVRVELPANATGGPILVDVDHDGHRDVAVPTAAGVFVARSNGTTFTAMGIDPKQTDPDLGTLVAAEDLDGDGLDDRIFQSGVRLTNVTSPLGDGGTEGGAPVVGDVRAIEIQGTIGGARVGRLNDDGFLDLAMFRVNSPDVIVSAGAAKQGSIPLFTSFTLTTNAAVQRIAIGDYDGDHVQDVAILTGVSSDEVELFIAYGRAIGGPEPPRFIGRVRNVVAMETVRVVENDAADALGILSLIPSKQKGVRPTAAFALAFGSGDRQQIVPLLMEDRHSKRPLPPTSKVNRPWYPAAIAAGAFATPGVPDLSLLAYAPGAMRGSVISGLWRVAAQREAAVPFGAPTETTVTDDTRVFGGTGLATFLAVGDLDRAPDGRAETVLLASDEGGRATLRIFGADGSAGAPISIGGTVAPGRSKLALLDVDGDGFDDVVMGLVDPNGVPSVVVAWNDGKGGFGGAPLVVPLPPDTAFDGGDIGARGFALVTTGGADATGGGRKETRLAVVTPRRLLLGAVANRTLTFTNLKLFGKNGLTNATGIASGDFDGDGVPDLALAENGAVRIVHQKPRLK